MQRTMFLLALSGLVGCATTLPEPNPLIECDLPVEWSVLSLPPQDALAVIDQVRTPGKAESFYWFSNRDGDLVLCSLSLDPDFRSYGLARPGCASENWRVTIEEGSYVARDYIVHMCAD